MDKFPGMGILRRCYYTIEETRTVREWGNLSFLCTSSIIFCIQTPWARLNRCRIYITTRSKHTCLLACGDMARHASLATSRVSVITATGYGPWL